MAGSKYVKSLPQFILFLSDYLTLDEKESKQGRDHIVEGTNSGHNVVVLEIPILAHRELRISV